MSKPWSKLKSRIMDLIDSSLKLNIHQSVYRMDSQRGSMDIPRYFITLDKEIVFDYPKDFVNDKVKDYKGIEVSVSTQYPHINQMSHISELIREYLDTPVKEVLMKSFNDPFKITDILKASDRRLGKEKVSTWAIDKSETINKIVKARKKI